MNAGGRLHAGIRACNAEILWQADEDLSHREKRHER